MEARDVIETHFAHVLEGRVGDYPAEAKERAEELLIALDGFGFEIRRKKPTAETLNATIAIHGKR